MPYSITQSDDEGQSAGTPQGTDQPRAHGGLRRHPARDGARPHPDSHEGRPASCRDPRRLSDRERGICEAARQRLFPQRHLLRAHLGADHAGSEDPSRGGAPERPCAGHRVR